MKKKFYLVAVMILAALVIVSCSPENLQDGKTANTKKQMTSTEYSENRGAIKSVSVVEAYAIANQDKATPSARGTSGEYKLPFNETTTIETDGENVEVDSTNEDIKEEKSSEEKEDEEEEGESLEDFEKSLREELDKEKRPLIKQ